MDDKPDGTTQKKDGTGDTTNPPPPTLSDEKDAAVGAQDAKNPGQVPSAEVPAPTPSRWMRFRRWLITPEGTGVTLHAAPITSLYVTWEVTITGRAPCECPRCLRDIASRSKRGVGQHQNQHEFS